MKSLGTKISELRKVKGMTQEELAQQLGVSSQAVSKWENDLSIPDVPVLIELAEFFHISLDDLLKTKESTVTLLPESERKNIDDMFLRVNVTSIKGDRVKVNLPLAIVRLALEMGMELPQVSGNEALKNIDFGMIYKMIESGVIGTLVEVDSADGDHVEVTVE